VGRKHYFPSPTPTPRELARSLRSTRLLRPLKTYTSRIINHVLTQFFFISSDIQIAFDQDWVNNSITYSGWNENATDNGVIAYKLLSHTGNGDEIDRSKVSLHRLLCLSLPWSQRVFFPLLNRK